MKKRLRAALKAWAEFRGERLPKEADFRAAGFAPKDAREMTKLCYDVDFYLRRLEPMVNGGR